MPSHFASTCATRTSDVSTGSMLPTSVATWKMTPRCADLRMSLGAFDLSRIDPAGYVRWLIRYHLNASFFSSHNEKRMVSDTVRHIFVPKVLQDMFGFLVWALQRRNASGR